MPQPKVFVGSSVEGLPVAEAFALELTYYADVTRWDQGPFGEPGRSTLQALIEAIDRFDFAVLALTPDDVVQSRGAEFFSPRDNVIFELGLCMGILGPERAVMLHSVANRLKMPSDLAGIITLTYREREDGNLQAALGQPATRFKQAIKRLGPRVHVTEAKTPVMRVSSAGEGLLTDARSEPEDMIRVIAKEYGDLTEVEEVHWTYWVESTGDGICERRWIVAPLPGVSRIIADWFEIGSVGESPSVGKGLEILRPRAWDIKSRQSLRFALYEEEPRKRVLVTFPPVEKGKRRSLGFYYKWPGLWKPLIDKLEDEGRTELSRTPKVKLEIIMPDDLRVVDFWIDPDVRYHLTKGRDRISFTLTKQIHKSRRYDWGLKVERV